MYDFNICAYSVKFYIPRRRYLRSAVPDLFMSTLGNFFGGFIVLTSLSNGRPSLPRLVFWFWFQCPLSVIQFC